VESAALDLINSEEWYGRDPDRVVDRISTPGWIDAFLAEWGFANVGQPTPTEVAELTRLRALLRGLVTTIATGQPLRRRDVDELDQISGAAPLRRRVSRARDGFSVEFVPERRDWRWVRAEIAASFAEVLEQGEWERIKVCANGECQWAFYDESKNRRRRWCGAASCGDLDKVRRFRERQRAASGAARTATPRPRRRSR
jgi:predicted RNA-binding Zn ribbon-like protein